MPELRYLTAGESHGPGLTVILEGIPAGLPLLAGDIDGDLGRRQLGYGRGERQAIERDQVEIRGGVRHGITLGGPIALWLQNRDFASWSDAMAIEPRVQAERRELTRPRPGHADLAGCRKLESRDARGVLERASARETAARVAAGAIARRLLRELEIEIGSHILSLGGIEAAAAGAGRWEDIADIPRDSPFRTIDPQAIERMRSEVDKARAAGDTLGGRFEVVAHTPPPGLGHFIQWDLRLDGRIAQAMMSIPAARSVALGAGEHAHAFAGSAMHDVIRATAGSGSAPDIVRPTNRAGGLEGGMTNGEELRVVVAMKPLSTLRRALESVDLASGERADAAFERSDITVVPAAGVVGEAMLALVLARAALEKYGGDSLAELLRNFRGWAKGAGWRPAP